MRNGFLLAYTSHGTRMRAAAFLAAIALVPGCQTVGAPAGLRAISLADVQAAKADADLHADATASLCYGALIAQLQIAEAPPVGVVSAYQRARDVRRYAASDALHVACGPLAVDALLVWGHSP